MSEFYRGAHVSDGFMRRWRSRRHVGAHAPWCRVKVRRGRLMRSYHTNWPDPQFGQVFGKSIRHQWYADWTPLDDWTELDGVYQIDLDQSFDKNGITVATLDVDNVAWISHMSETGDIYHDRERGYLWPWRGWHPKHRPGSQEHRNMWYNRLPYAQIQVEQGYGEDTAVKTFTGLIDTLSAKSRPDRMTISSRDFGAVLADSYMFGFNKDKALSDPITFTPPDHKFLKIAKGDGKTHSWIVVHDAVEIVKCVLRWAGFKEWEIEDSGVSLSVPYTVDKSKSYMDVINDVKAQLGYVFFIAEPTGRDDSIGVPIFRRSSVLVRHRSKPINVRDKDLLTDIQPQHDNKDDRYIIRVRGAVNKKTGRYIGVPAQDNIRRVTFTYWPPWSLRMAGVIRQLTFYNIGDASAIGFTTQQQCAVAALLIAVQIALARDTATAQTAGQPAFGLDSFAYITDKGSGVASRLYVTNRKSTMTLGGSGSGPVSTESTSGGSQLLWATEIGGSLCDNPQFAHVVWGYRRAVAGKDVPSWDDQLFG